MTTTHAEHADVPAIELPIGGMTCQGCVANITRGLTKLEGVGEANVNLVTKRATVRPDGTVDPAILDEAIRSTITGLGYEVLSAPPTEHDRGHSAHHGEPHTAMSREDEHAAHLASDAARVTDYRRRFTLAAILSVPLLVVSMVEAWQFSGWEWVAAALATPVVFWSGWPFHRSALKNARHRATNMDTLVSLGTAASWTWSTVVLVGRAFGAAAFDSAHVYYETGAVIVTLILLGKWMEVRSTARAGDAIRALGQIQVDVVTLEDGRTISRDDLVVGMRFVTRPGETIATDGVVVDGEAAVDASMVTGESVPVEAASGTEVVGGTIATDGALTIEATRVGSETMLAQIARMVDEAQSGKANIQRLADRIASVFVPVVILLALATLGIWLALTGDANRAFTAAVAVLIISCPCALGLATPLAIMVGTGRGAQLGTLIHSGQVLEDARRLDVVVLDKTGTVTEGRMEAIEVIAPDVGDAVRREITLLAASVEARSEHPIGRAVAALASKHRVVKDFRVTPGRGVTAVVDGARGKAPVAVSIGSRRLFDSVSVALEDAASTAEATGATVVFVGRGSVPVSAEAVMVVRDTIKPSSRDAVAALRSLGLDVVLLTGDNERAARAIAAEAGIDRVEAEVLPSEKAAAITSLQAEGKRVAMVGDGINDAPALAQSDLGIAVGTGTDVAREASDLTIVSGDLMAVVTAIRLARRTFSTIRGNLFWAFAYNVVAIPLAAFGILNPMIASGAMGTSSLFVVGNSLRLRAFAVSRG